MRRFTSCPASFGQHPITEANKKKMESYKRLEEAMNSLIGGDGEYARWTEPLLAMLKKMKPADQKDMLDKLVRTWLNMPIDEKEGQEAVDFVAKATGWEEKK